MKLPILENAVLYMNQAFLQNQNPEPPQFKQKIIGEGEDAPLATIGRQIKQMIASHEGEKARIDGKVAQLFHTKLALTRREAANMRFWHFLSIAQFPFYVAWRYFDDREGKVNRDRYLGALDDNAFSRLWWWAELTADRDRKDYERTLKGAESGEFVKGTVQNLLGGNRALVNSLIDILFDQKSRPSDSLVNGVFSKLNAMLVTVAVDALNAEDIRRLVIRVYQHESRT